MHLIKLALLSKHFIYDFFSFRSGWYPERGVALIEICFHQTYLDCLEHNKHSMTSYT